MNVRNRMRREATWSADPPALTRRGTSAVSRQAIQYAWSSANTWQLQPSQTAFWRASSGTHPSPQTGTTTNTANAAFEAQLRSFQRLYDEQQLGLQQQNFTVTFG